MRESQFSGGYSRTVYQTLYWSYRPFLWRCATLILIGFLGRLLLLSNANITGLWVDSLCPGGICPTMDMKNFMDTSRPYLLGLVGVTTVGFTFTALFRVGFSRLSARAVSRLHDEVMYRVSRYPMSFFDQTPVGRVVTRFSSDYGNVFRLFGGPLAEFISIVSDLVVSVILISVASPAFAPWLLLSFFINGLIYRLHRDRLRKERRELSSLRSPAIAHFSETVQGSSSIRAYLKVATFQKRFQDLNRIYLRQKLRTVYKLNSFSFQMSLVTATLILAFGWTAVSLKGSGWVTVGGLAASFGFVVLATSTVQMFFDWLAQFEEAMTGVERLDEYLRIQAEPGARVPRTAEFPVGLRDYEINPVMDRAVRAAEVEFDNVWMRYRPDLPPVLRGVSFKIPAGEKWGIVGRTGDGKSSLLQALFHLYPLEAGRIRVQGVSAHLGPEDVPPAGQISLVDFRKQMAFITQEPVLLKGTLRENLSLSASEERIWEALAVVGLADWVKGLPGGLDSLILERGKNLSAGERQLICMARCTLQEAPVIVMDEATSNVDPQSEEWMGKASREAFRGRTRIVIAHRLSTLADCDGVIWLQAGQVHMAGPADEVLSVYKGSHAPLDAPKASV